MRIIENTAGKSNTLQFSKIRQLYQNSYTIIISYCYREFQVKLAQVHDDNFLRLKIFEKFFLSAWFRNVTLDAKKIVTLSQIFEFSSVFSSQFSKISQIVKAKS